MLQLGAGIGWKKKHMSLKLLLFPFHPIIWFWIHKYFHVWDPVSKKRYISSCSPSVELNQILWVNLIAVKNYINLWIGHIIHTTVIKVGEAGILGGWSAVHRMTDCVFSNKHSGQEHGFIRWLTSKYWWGESMSLQGGVVLPRGVTEFTGVFGIPGKVAPWKRELWEKLLKPYTTNVMNCFMLLHHNTEGSTFAIDIAMASCQPPVKVKCTYSLYVAVSCAMKQHSLLNIQCALDFSQLCFLP